MPQTTPENVWKDLTPTCRNVLTLAGIIEGQFTARKLSALATACNITLYDREPNERDLNTICQEFYYSGLFLNRTQINPVMVPLIWIKAAESDFLPTIYKAITKLDAKRKGKDATYRRVRRNILYARFAQDLDLLRVWLPDALQDPYMGKLLVEIANAGAPLILPDTPFGVEWCAFKLVIYNRNAIEPHDDFYAKILKADVDSQNKQIPAALCEAAFYHADFAHLERLSLAYGDQLPSKAFLNLLHRDYEAAANVYATWHGMHANDYSGYCSGRFLQGIFSAITGAPDVQEDLESKNWGLAVLHPDQVFALIAEAKRSGSPLWGGELDHPRTPQPAYLATIIAIRAKAIRSTIHRDNHEHLWNGACAANLYWWMAEIGPTPTAPRSSNSPQAPLPAEVAALLDKNGCGPVSSAPFTGASWKHHLKVLETFLEEQIKPKSSLKPHDNRDRRIVWWILDSQFSDEIEFEPREQTLSRGKKWTKGKAIPLRRFCGSNGDPLPNNATEYDDALRAGIRKAEYTHYSGYSRHSRDCELDLPKFLPALANHPLVFHADRPNAPIQINVQEPRLTITKTQVGHHVELNPMPEYGGEEVLFVWDSPTRLTATLYNERHRKLAGLLENEEIVIPAEGLERLSGIQTSAETLFQVDSDISSPRNADAESADLTLHVLTEPEENGLVFSVRVDPAQCGQYLRPGEGATRLSRQDGDRQTRVARDLDKEREIAESAILEALKAKPDDDWDWFFPDPADALAALSGFHNQEDKGVKLIWPRGTPIKVTPKVESQSLSMKMEDQTDWFECTGELNVSADLSIGLGELLQLMTKRVGNFIQLSDSHYVELSQHLRRQLEQMSHAHSGKMKGPKVRFHPILAVDNSWIDELGNFKPSPRWQYLREQVENWQPPDVPTTLEAELRPYQIEGFQWLAQHTSLALGACLADDMGLGKTLQAIAVSLLHAHDGPILVIAPTSVCSNWVSEIRKFAPTLRARSLANVNDREKLITEAKAFDVIVCSYGLMQTTTSLLERVWRLLIIDEAQAIKNPMTQRAKAACALQAVSRIATTGTPVENHIGELWSLFRFLNPGLLGSLNAFRSQYNDLATAPKLRRQLQQTLRPFILRRTKAQVLDDLPPRTEINLPVELSENEVALYEAIRRKALEKISDADPQEQKGRFTILAEIMRLRRACCHPTLVDSELTFPGSKLERLLDVVDDLRENSHRALVFSQFVDHLSVIRKALDKRKIPYQYLDGSTTPKRREKAVQAFQSGEGDLFLISLKAGGVGLNLTGADYVIHMDPWWNPAVEDQASDRAHRIGQTRPVTIYRLVAKDTIEEKILELHARKRKIADQIISDTDGPVSLDELREMLAARTPSS